MFLLVYSLKRRQILLIRSKKIRISKNLIIVNVLNRKKIKSINYKLLKINNNCLQILRPLNFSQAKPPRKKLKKLKQLKTQFKNKKKL